MKVFRIDQAAERLGLSEALLELLETEGRLTAEDRVNGVSYYSQASLDQTIQGMLCSLQRASWGDMESRMEAVESQIEELQTEFRKMRDGLSRVL